MKAHAIGLPGARRFNRRVAASATGALTISLAVLVVVLRLGGGAPSPAQDGLPDAGSAVGWGLPIARTVADLCLMATVGTALLAVLLPPRRGRLTTDARRALRTCAGAALCAAVAYLATAVLSFADEVGDNAVAWSPRMVWTYLPADPSAAEPVLSAGLLALVAVAAGWAAHSGRDSGTAGPLLLGYAAILPIALTGHARTGSAHLLALASLAVHLLAVCSWVGGLGALTGYALRRGRALADVLPRFSAVAAACYAAVGVSGVANAATRTTRLNEVVASDYGRLVLAKATAFALLGLVALGQRRRVLPALAAIPRTGFAQSTGVRTGACSDPSSARAGAARHAFIRLATIETVLMAATVGLAVALSRTPPPAPALSTSPYSVPFRTGADITVKDAETALPQAKGSSAGLTARPQGPTAARRVS